MKKKMFIFIIPLMIIVTVICSWAYANTGLKRFEKEVSKITLPENVEVIAKKSGIGDSGGNGDQSTYRVVLAVKTKMSLEELNQEFENRKMTFSSHVAGSNKPICYITLCKENIFKSDRKFELTFGELECVKEFDGYYFIEFIK